MAARLEARRAGVRLVTVTAPARRPGLAWPRPVIATPAARAHARGHWRWRALPRPRHGVRTVAFAPGPAGGLAA
jgi:hypothetical protein